MHPNHLISLRLENFKRFKDLAIDDIGLVNLIVGDNNVGKTSVLEALVVRDYGLNDGNNEGSSINNEYFKRYFTDLTYILDNYKKFRNVTGNVIEYYANMQEKDSSFSISFERQSKVPFTLTIKNLASDKWQLSVKNGTNLSATPYEHRHTPSHFPFDPSLSSYNFANPFFIPYFLGYANDLTNYYSEHIQRDSELKQKFIESLQVIIPDLSDVLIDTAMSTFPVLIIQRRGFKRNMPLATFGDGFTNLFRLMIEIYRNEGKRIMLDEIDYGVHFDRKTGFWKAIIHAAQSNQVQIFATTHNNECISSLQEAGKDDNHLFGKDIRIIRLAEVKDKNIKAYTFNFDQFTHAIENENELR